MQFAQFCVGCGCRSYSYQHPPTLHSPGSVAKEEMGSQHRPSSQFRLDLPLPEPMPLPLPPPESTYLRCASMCPYSMGRPSTYAGTISSQYPSGTLIT